MVERARTTRTYFATGALESVGRHHRLGGVTDWEYYPTGARKEKLAEGWLGTYSRAWDQAGHLTRHTCEGPLGAHPLQRLRNYLRRTHPLRTMQRKLRRFQPMQPVYRAFRKAFPRHDHHVPRPPKG